jgi:hypothetical protein
MTNTNKMEEISKQDTKHIHNMDISKYAKDILDAQQEYGKTKDIMNILQSCIKEQTWIPGNYFIHINLVRND